MNYNRVLKEFIAIAIKREGYDKRDNAKFTLKEIKEVLSFFIKTKKEALEEASEL